MRQSKIEIVFRSPERLNQPSNFSTGIFNVTTPSTYVSYVRGQVEEAYSLVPQYTRLTGVDAPSGFHLRYISPESSGIDKETAGQYYGGEIEIKSTQLGKARILSLETLLHEIAHGFNDRLSSGSPDWWWEEGTADYLAHTILASAGYNTSVFNVSRDKIENTFDSCNVSRGFIANWSPIDGVTTRFECEYASETSLYSDADSLGYDYSKILVSDMLSEGDILLRDIYIPMIRMNVSFVNTRPRLNNQINYIASQAADTNYTPFLRQRGIPTDDWTAAQREIEATGDLLSTYREDNPIDILSGQKEEFTDLRRTAYRGNFAAIPPKASQLREEIRDIQGRFNSTYLRYESVSTRVGSLEEQEQPRFYESAWSELNRSVDLMKEHRFEAAGEAISAANSSATEIKEDLRRYVRTIQTTEEEVTATSPLFTPFLLGAGDDVEKSQQAYESGHLEKARDTLRTAQLKSTAAPLLGIGFYLSLLIGAVLLYRWKTG
ncbi:MAG: hypothetical protein ABEK12_02580 [Candidatus Nanohaloarchaea archaeon]